MVTAWEGRRVFDLEKFAESLQTAKRKVAPRRIFEKCKVKRKNGFIPKMTTC